MKWLKVLIAVCFLGIISFGGFKVYATGYSGGETAGYENGYSAGHEVGYASGETDGFTSGKTDGYNLGSVAGYLSGQQDGYNSGKADGYEEGYSLGVEAGLGHGYTLKDPTYNQAITFLNQDKTDENEYVDPTYMCSHFARDVNNNAEANGFRCAIVYMVYPDSGHSIIAFDTVDRGLVYFEPQKDETVKPVIGKRFYQCVEPRPGYYYTAPAFDDTIIDILVNW